MGARLGLAAMTWLAATAAAAATIHVPAEWPTIQAGLAAAAAADTVLLADGTYRGPGNRDLDFKGKAIVLRSAGGSHFDCVIDSEGSEAEPHRAFHFHSGEGPAAAIEGIGITGGWQPTGYIQGGGGLFCENGSRPSLRACRLFENAGSAIYARQQSGLALSDCMFEGNVGSRGGALQCVEGDWTIVRCAFVGNRATVYGGALSGHGGSFDVVDCYLHANECSCGAAVNMIYGSQARFLRCHFDGNYAPQSYWDTIVNLHGMVAGHFEDCTFEKNRGESGGWLIVMSKMSHGELDGCTFVHNAFPNGALVRFGELDGRVANTLFASNPAGQPLQIDHIIALTCTDIYDNGDGNWLGNLAPYLGIDGNISEDPQFCDPAERDFTLHDSSPCAPANSGCGLIGAWPVACGSTSSAASSWSRIKSLF